MATMYFGGVSGSLGPDGNLANPANWFDSMGVVAAEIPLGGWAEGLIRKSVTAGGYYATSGTLATAIGVVFAPTSSVGCISFDNYGTINAPGVSFSCPVTNHGWITSLANASGYSITNAAGCTVNGGTYDGTIVNDGQFGGSGTTVISSTASFTQSAATASLTKTTGTTTVSTSTISITGGSVGEGVIGPTWLVPGNYGKRAVKAGNWSDTAVATSPWLNQSLPIAGDVVDLAGYVVTMDVGTIPASGSLGGIISPGKAGQLAVSVTSGSKTIASAKNVGGTNNTGLIVQTGATNRLTLNGEIAGGSASQAVGLLNSGMGYVTVSGDAHGGTGPYSYGCHQTGSWGGMTINGSVFAGSGSYAGGAARVPTGNNAMTIAGSVIDSASAMALMGPPPNWQPPAGAYYQIASGLKFPPQLDANQVLDGVAHGDRTGNITLPDGGNVIDDAPHYGPDSATVPTYHAALPAEVVSTTMFGVDAATQGEYPTTAYSQAQQRADDQDEITAVAYAILDTVAPLGIAGEIPLDYVLRASGGHYYPPSVAIVREGSPFGVDNLEEGAYSMAADVAAATSSATALAVVAALAMTPIHVERLVKRSGELTLNRGDDYLQADGRAIQFGLPASSLDLTAAVPHLVICTKQGGLPDGVPIIDSAGTIETGEFTIQGVAYTRVVQFELSTDETALLINAHPRAYAYTVKALWASGTTVTLVDDSDCTASW